MYNRPLVFFDAYGLSSEQINERSSGFWSRGWNQVGGALKNIYYSPRFQGAMQAFGGLVETGVGAGMTFSTGGIAGPLGWPIMAHGLDHYVTGMNTVWSGITKDTISSQLLQQTGMSSATAGFVDNSIGIVGTMGGTAALKIYGGNIANSFGRNNPCGLFLKEITKTSSGVQSTKVNRPRVNKLMPYPESQSLHSSFKRDSRTNIITGYETYELNSNTGKFSPKVRFRGKGKPHGGVEPPFILERREGKGIGSEPIEPRKLNPMDIELPYGY